MSTSGRLVAQLRVGLLALLVTAGCSTPLADFTAKAIPCPKHLVTDVSKRVNSRWTARCSGKLYTCASVEEALGGAYPTDPDYRTFPKVTCVPATE